jgi:CHC2 zinc finger
MRNIRNNTGYDGYGTLPGETGDSSAPVSGKAFYQNLINKANTVPLTRIFKHYNVRVGSLQSTIICPFKFHKGGRENTGSFTYYPLTNSFHCYGCKTGGPFAHAAEFVAAMDGISKAKAAFKILEFFPKDASDPGEILEGESFSEHLEIMMDLSNSVRDFRQSHFDENSFVYIEYACSVYDRLNLAHKNMSNEAQRRIVGLIKDYIAHYDRKLRK